MFFVSMDDLSGARFLGCISAMPEKKRKGGDLRRVGKNSSGGAIDDGFFPRRFAGYWSPKEEEKNENSAVHLMSRGQKKRGAAIYAGGVFWNDGRQARCKREQVSKLFRGGRNNGSAE